jgi:uncharacterized protein (DUF2147 family)
MHRPVTARSNTDEPASRRAALRRPRKRGIVCAVAFVAAVAAAGAQAQTPEGRWLTEAKDGVVELYRCGDALCGRLVWFRMRSLQDNPQALDIHNPTPALRNRSLCGLAILSDFRADGPGRWSGGSAYDPASGHTYSGQMTLEADGRLNMRGYVGITLFGRSEDWTRYTQPIAHCPDP